MNFFKYCSLFLIMFNVFSCYAADKCFNVFSAKDYLEIEKMCKIQCDDNQSLACMLLGDFYSNSIDKQDYDKAKKYSEKACLLGHSIGCFNVAIIYIAGKGVKIDHDLASIFL